MAETRTLALRAGLVGVPAAIALATATIAPWEGKRNEPYRDLVGVPTVCYGETRVPMRRYSDAECTAMLRRAIEVDFAPDVLKCTPQVAERPRVFAAAISLSYNIGTGAYCRSSIARRFKAREFAAGCRLFPAWNRAGGRVVQGLVNRRAAEMRLCLSGAS